MLIELGGDNLAATFSPELADLTIYVIDVAAGEKIPSKGGPGITRSDLLVINKIDLAPHVGASLEVMQRDAQRMRGARPFIMTNLRIGQGLDDIVRFIERKGRAGRCWRSHAKTDERVTTAGAAQRKYLHRLQKNRPPVGAPFHVHAIVTKPSDSRHFLC